jgi:hypothetical protein
MRRLLTAIALVAGLAVAACTPSNNASSPAATDPGASVEPSMSVESEAPVESMSPEVSP